MGNVLSSPQDASKELDGRREKFAIALALGKSPRTAGRAVKVHERTAWRWMNEDAVLNRAEWVRKRMMRQWQHEGWSVVRRLALDESVGDATRLNAAKVLIEGSFSGEDAPANQVLVLSL